MARKIEPGSCVETPDNRKCIVISGEKRGKKYHYKLEDESGNQFDHVETGLVITDSTPAEQAVIEEPTVKNPLTSMLGFPKFRAIHPMQKVTTQDGKVKRVQNNEDSVAMELLAWTLEGKDLYLFPDVAAAGDSEVLHAKYSHLNAGMQRMNVGNKVRGYRKPKVVKASVPEEATEDE
jgi:hypothetical protein